MARELELQQQAAFVENAFRKLYPPPVPQAPESIELKPWLYAVYAGFAIIRKDDQYFKAAYTIEGDEAVFVAESEWREVAKETVWSPMKQDQHYLLTPKDWWEELNKEFNFSIDAAASKTNHLCETYYSAEDSAFDHSWVGNVWCSPPWIEPQLFDWVHKAMFETVKGTAETVVMLLPVRRETLWWKQLESYASEIRMIEPGLKFMPEDGFPPNLILVEKHCLFVFKAEISEETFEAASGKAEKSDEEIVFDVEAPCGQKAIKIADPEQRKIEAYATIWGELDCDGERMTKQAVQKYVEEPNHIPLMLWKHGLDPEFGSEIIGHWIKSEFVMDDLGLKVAGIIHSDTHGNRAWNRITATKGFGLSVGTIWYMVKRNKLADGSVNIVNWPLLEISAMEGGKQCVPSARRDLKADYAQMMTNYAVKQGIIDERETIDVTKLQAKARRLLGLESFRQRADLESTK